PRRVVAYRLLLMRGIGELMMTSTATALRHLSPTTVRRFWGWYLNRPQSVDHILSDSRIADHGRMMNAPGYQAAYLATLRSLAARSSLRDGVALDRELRQLSMPVLLVWGRHDHLFPPSHALAAAAQQAPASGGLVAAAEQEEADQDESSGGQRRGPGEGQPARSVKLGKLQML